MSRVLTNLTSFAFAAEESRGVLPASPDWKRVEPNKVNAFGAAIKTVSRQPISKTRQVKKGTVVDLDSAVQFDADATLDSLVDFVPSFIFAEPHGGTVFDIAQITGSSKTIRIVSELAASAAFMFLDSLLFVRGCAVAANNGLKTIDSYTAAVAASKLLTLATDAADGDTVTIGSVVYTFETGALDTAYKVKVQGTIAGTALSLSHAINGTGVVGTDYAAGTVVHPTVIATDHADGTMTATARTKGSAGNAIAIAEASSHMSWAGGALFLSGGSDLLIVVEETMADETPAATRNATVELAGYRGAATEFSITAQGELASNSVDFTTLGLTAGQAVYVGDGVASATHSFAVAANQGFARIVTVAAALLTLDKTSAAFSTDLGTGKLVYLLFGRFLRNVAVDHADYVERTLQFEGTFPNLGDAGETEYEYAIGNECNTIELNLPLTNKATCSFNFLGQDVETFVESQKTNAANARSVTQSEAVNTSADIARLRITQVDESGLTTDFKSLKLSLNNNANPEKVLAQLGAKYVNVGLFEVGIEAQVVFTSKDVTAAIRANTTVTMDFALKNHDGGVFVDIPSMTLGGGGRDYPVNQSVLLSLTGTAFEDAILGTSLGFSLFPYLPLVA